MPSVAPKNNTNTVDSNEFISKEIEEKERKLKSEKIIIENANKQEPEIFEKKPYIEADTKFQTYSDMRTENSGKGKLSDTKGKFDSLGLFKNKKTVFLMFIIPPVIISLISAYHLITFYSSANPFNTAIVLAFAIEMASVSSLIALAFLDKLRRRTVWTIFLVLVTLQILGNTFHSFVYLQQQTELAKLLFNFLSLDNSLPSYRIVSLIMGLPLPIIALAFIKGAVEYLE
jgi:hypothetical protein